MPDIKDLIAQRNVLSDETVRYIEGYLIYLRKSRQDDPNETVEETLSKHEIELQNLAKWKLGGLIPEENIYREIVSGGESIDEREEMRKVLSRIESDEIKGVLVVDPQRLSRGSLTDCDRLIMSFQYTGTLVITTTFTYDLRAKHLRRSFQDELMRGRDYLDYVKSTLWAGRDRASRRGCYITGTPPFGYDKIKIGRDCTLEPNDSADAVRMIFDWYVEEGLSASAIAYRLEAMGIKPQKSEHWALASVDRILKNPVYAGVIRYNYRKKTPVMEDGKVVIREQHPDEAEIIYTEGKHPAIISQELFDAAQNRAAQNARVKNGHRLNNVLAGVLRCAGCGHAMRIVQSGNTASRRRIAPYYNCPTQKKPGVEGRGKKCYKSAKVEVVVDAVIATLEQVELPKLQAKLANGDGNAAAIQKRRIASLNKQMEEYRDQENNLYDLLETKQYTPEVFNRRHAVLQEKMDACEKELFLARQAMPKNVDYGEKIVELEEAIRAMRDPDMSNEEKNRILRTIIERIEYSAVDEGMGKTAVNLEVFLRL